MRISSAIIAAGLVAGFCTAASAQTDGFYVGAEAGVNFVPKEKYDTLNHIWSEKHDAGYGVLGQVGYGFGNIRVEGELGWRDNGVSHFSDQAGDHSVDGNLGLGSVMANVYYDFVNDSKFTPYIGAGFGGAYGNFDNLKASGTSVTDDGDVMFAYQGIAGVAYAVNDQLSIKADYRYLGTATNGHYSTSPQYDGNYGGTARGEYSSHAVMVGFTWKFGAPPQQAVAQQAAAPVPPAPAPAPAPAPKPVQAAPIPKNFMIFFDFDKSDLTPEAKSILTQSVDAAKKQNATGFDLTGYTDTVGSNDYNMKLSVRRAEAAKKFLVSLGVPEKEISTHGKGKQDLLVPTKDGVREAQNRRVQIVLQ